MAEYTHIIGRQNTNTAPAWRRAMSNIRTIYTVGPASVNAALGPSWPGVPGGVVPPRFTTRGVGEDNILHYGWNTSVFVPDAGSQGKLVFYGAGENYWGNDSTAFDLATGTWEWWQGPHFCLSESEAATQNADTYYDPIFAATLPANRQLQESQLWYDSWDKQFPVAHTGWIYRRKFSGHTHGNNRHWAGRYNVGCVIPASMTGTGRSAVVMNGASWQGPFSQGPTPSGYRPFSDWVEDTASLNPAFGSSSGFQRGTIFWQDPSTKQWSRLTPKVPDYVGWGVYNNPAAVDEVNKRIYCIDLDRGRQYYIDCTSGIANATMSSVTAFTQSGAGCIIGDHTSSVYTANHPTGRRLMFFRGEAVDANRYNSLVMIDLDTNIYYGLQPIPGLDMDRVGLEQPHCGLAYIPNQGAYGTLVLTTKTTDRGALAHYIPLPADPTVASNYSATTVSLSLNTGVTLENNNYGISPNIFMYGQGKGGYLPELGVIITPQVNGPLLVYRPF